MVGNKGAADHRVQAEGKTTTVPCSLIHGKVKQRFVQIELLWFGKDMHTKAHVLGVWFLRKHNALG